MSEVMYWPIGRSIEVPLRFSLAEVCRFLVSDWLPTLPLATAQSIFGWPFFLIRLEQGSSSSNYWVMEPLGGWSDRQWKGVLSWMIGIAGTRKVLNEEQYQYIAPCSAFYPERRRIVVTPSWHISYPPSVLKITQNPVNTSRLRPDYIVARRLPNGRLEFALTESKGTSNCLDNMTTCPIEWKNQARNGILTINGSQVAISRHIVVATRCNPNAVREKTRRIQIRAWNSKSNEFAESVDNALLLELLSAHYFGICRNLGLKKNQKSLSLAVSYRHDPNSVSQDELNKLVQDAEVEFGECIDEQSDTGQEAYFSIEHERGKIHIQLSSQAMMMIRNLRSGGGLDEIFSTIIQSLNEINDWFNKANLQYEGERNVAVDRSGFLVKTEEV